MSFVVLVNVRSGPADEPDWEAGAKISARKLGRKAKGGGVNEVRYIQITLGRKLASGMSLMQETHRLTLQFGTGNDAGKLALSVDNSSGEFPVKRDAQRRYRLSLNAATVADWLKLEFPVLFLPKVELVKLDQAKPVFAVLDVGKIVK